MSVRWNRAKARAQRVAINYYGEDVVYVSARLGASGTVRAVFDNGAVDIDPSDRMPTTSTQPKFAVIVDDLPAVPDQDDVITRPNGDVYLVVDMQPDGLGMCDLICHARQPSGTMPRVGGYWPI